jgi:two-component system sensor histidine kinase BarA
VTRKGGTPGGPMEPVELEKAVDADKLQALTLSCHGLFEVPVRLFSANGTLLAEAGAQASICQLVGRSPSGRKACAEVVAKVKRAGASATAPTTIRCFTGARYDILPLQHAGEPGGRFVVGPYRMQGDANDGSAPGDNGLPPSLQEVDERMSPDEATEQLRQMARLDADRAEQLRAHLVTVFEAVLSSGYEALVTSKMHVATTRESYHQLKTKNAELQDAHDRLKELDGLKSSFLSTISHELRTPLTSILGYADMLLNEMAGPLQPEQREFVSIIQRQGDRLLKLIRTLLDMSRLEKGTMPMERAGVNLRAVLADVVTTMTPVAIDKGVYLDLALPQKGGAEDLPLVTGDADRLHQVFLNLVENAVKFSAPGGYVTLSAAPGDDPDTEGVGYILYAPLRKSLAVRVADTGPGVPDRSKTRIFDAFYQLDHSSTREHAGTGLGLAIVRRIVDAHNGSIHVEDNTPQGCVFVVQLPLYEPQG